MFYGGVARSRSGAAARALCHLISIIRIPDTEYGYPDSLLMHVNTNMDTGYRLSMHARVSYLYFDLWTLQLARAWLGIMDDYEQFLHLHLTQLRRVPEHLWTALHYKLRAEVYDAGDYFMMSPSRGRWRVLVTHRGRLVASDPNSVFLVDHAWTFQPHLVARQLRSIPGLVSRMAGLMDLDGFPCLSGEEADSEELSEEEEEEEVGEEGREKGGEIEGEDSRGGEEGRKDGEEGEVVVPLSAAPNKPPPQTDTAASKLVTPTQRRRADQSDSSSSSSSSSGAGKRRPGKALLAPVKGGPGYDSLSGYESYAGYESCDVVEEVEGYRAAVEVDVEKVQPEVTNQIAVLVEEAPPTEEVVAWIQEAMWRFCHPYSVNNSQVPVWYIMDEFGSRIPHSDTPSVALTTFFYIPRQLAYCVLWPLTDLKFRDTVTRDYLQAFGSGVADTPLQRACHLLPWSHDHHLTLDDPRWQGLPQCTVPEAKERCNESLPDPSLPAVSHSPPYSVYTDIVLVRTFLTHSSFSSTEVRGEADIVWSYEHFKDFGSPLPNQFINQFACENILTCKDLLVETAKRTNHPGASPDPQDVGGVAKWAGPSWLPETYNLLYELPRLVHRYMQAQEREERNLWIVKPWNLGRGMDIHITSSLHHIIRLAQAGPKIASRYIADPVLFQRPEVGTVKFDYRYMILLKSAQPLEAYVYNVFWLRFANKPFSLDSFYDYEKHFTVMNYKDNVKLKQIHYNEFIPLFEEQYPDYPWAQIQEATFQMLLELLQAACSAPPPAGIAPSTQSRAIYAADLMLEWNRDTEPPGIEPRLLEVNFCPDCVRVCRYHPDFFNHMFEVLFLEPSQWSPDLPVTRLA